MKRINRSVCGKILLMALCAFPVMSRAEEVKVRAVMENAIVRLKPEIDSLILVFLALGTELEMLEQAEEWFKVKLPPDEKGFTAVGFIHSSMAEIVVEKALEKKPSEPVSGKDRPSKKPVALQLDRIPKRTPMHRTSGIEMGIKLCGSRSYFLPDDLNNAIKGQNDFWYHNYEDNPNSVMKGELEPLHFGYQGGGEVFVNFAPFVGIGLGIGYFYAEKKSSFSYSGEHVSWELVSDPEIKAIPITSSLYIGLPLGKFMKVILYGGIGYYFVKCKHDRSHYWTDISDNTADYLNSTSMEQNSLGYHGGLDFELNLGRSFAFVVGLSGRYVVLKDLEAEDQFRFFYNEELGFEEMSRGTLWFGEYEEDGEWFPGFSIGAEEPSYPDWRHVRKAEIALTGVSLQLGLKFKFSTFSSRNK